MDKYLGAKDIMAILKIGRSTVYELFKRDNFPTIHIGKRVFVSEAALREWLAAGGTAQDDRAV